jgi:hypothetical protein
LNADSKLIYFFEHKKFAELNVNPVFSLEAYKTVHKKWWDIIRGYIINYIPLNKFINHPLTPPKNRRGAFCVVLLITGGEL